MPEFRKRLENEEIEIKLLIEGIYQKYGYDFRGYSLDSLKRRVLKHVKSSGLKSVSALQEEIIYNPDKMKDLMISLSVGVSDFFRDPAFFKQIRELTRDFLKTYPFVRIWHAGCSTGEEVYSMSIILHEENLYEKSRIYATDMNEDALLQCKSGIYHLGKMQQYTENYQNSGGKKSFSDYYTAKYGSAVFKTELKKNLVVSNHNLVTDSSFNEFNLILCRNVMIYFDKELQANVHKLLYESLPHFGILALGDKENLKFTPYESCYETLSLEHNIFRKVK